MIPEDVTMEDITNISRAKVTLFAIINGVDPREILMSAANCGLEIYDFFFLPDLRKMLKGF